LNDFLLTRAIQANIVEEDSLGQMHVKYDYESRLLSA
jgi:hypothetical protein